MCMFLNNGSNQTSALFKKILVEYEYQTTIGEQRNKYGSGKLS